MKSYQPVFRERESFSSLSGSIFGESRQNHNGTKQSILQSNNCTVLESCLCLARLNNISNIQPKQSLPSQLQERQPEPSLGKQKSVLTFLWFHSNCVWNNCFLYFNQLNQSILSLQLNELFNLKQHHHLNVFNSVQMTQQVIQSRILNYW